LVAEGAFDLVSYLGIAIMVRYTEAALLLLNGAIAVAQSTTFLTPH
jgi:hypothetical protein